jgi:hypothetical protein
MRDDNLSRNTNVQPDVAMLERLDREPMPLSPFTRGLEQVLSAVIGETQLNLVRVVASVFTGSGIVITAFNTPKSSGLKWVYVSDTSYYTPFEVLPSSSFPAHLRFHKESSKPHDFWLHGHHGTDPDLVGILELLDSEEVPGDVDTRADEFGLRCAAVPDALWVQHDHGFWSKKIFWR